MSRNCTYGPVTPNGRCPSKPKECAYGTRKNGVCPRAPCKWGKLESGKCRGKPASMRCASGALRGPPDYLCKTVNRRSSSNEDFAPRSDSVSNEDFAPRSDSVSNEDFAPRSDSVSDYDAPLRVLAKKPKFSKSPQSGYSGMTTPSSDLPIRTGVGRMRQVNGRISGVRKTIRASSDPPIRTGVGRMRQVNGRISGVRKTIRARSGPARDSPDPAYDSPDSEKYLPYNPISPRHTPKRPDPVTPRPGSRPYSPTDSHFSDEPFFI
jgi:hypothetical protein